MAIDLTRIIYKKLTDGAYTISVKSWDIKSTTKGEDYVVLNTTLPEQNNRAMAISLFEKSLNITASNVSEHLELGEISLVEVLDAMVGKDLPAFHQTVLVDDKTYYNWYICSVPRETVGTSLGDDDEF